MVVDPAGMGELLDRLRLLLGDPEDGKVGQHLAHRRVERHRPALAPFGEGLGHPTSLRLEDADVLQACPGLAGVHPAHRLDPQTRIRIWDYVRDINQKGTTIFLTTHYMDEADQLSYRISIIDHGKIVVTGRPWELKNALGQDLIYLETSDNWTASDLLKKLESVKGVREKSKGIIAMVNVDGTYLLPEIIDKLKSGGIRIRAVNLKKPSMDDVFVHYTGRELRDTGMEKGSTVSQRARGR